MQKVGGDRSGVTTLFSELPSASKRPSVFLVSTALHAAAFWLIWFGLHHAVKLVPANDRYTVRLLNLDQPPPRPHSAAAATQPLVAPPLARDASREQADRASVRKSPARALSAPAATGNPGRAAAPATPQLVAQTQAVQTLMQPNAPLVLVPENLPIPRVVIWKPKASEPKLLAPPVPQRASAKDLQPSPNPPVKAQRIANVEVAPSPVPTMPDLAASSTTPILLPRATPLNRVPESASVHPANPASAQVLSLSDIELQRGVAPLPQISEIARGSANSLMGVLNSPSSGSGKTPAQQSGAAAEGSGQGVLAGPATNGIGTNGSGRLDSAAGPGANAQAGGPGQSGAGASGSLHAGGAVTRILVPRNGQFGFVVVGGSMAEDDPEAPDVWGSRLVYSVYLHVGLAHNWILQFALPRDSHAARTKNTVQPKAPWPYLIVRPHLDPGDWDTDTILVHGFVNVNGHFERLAVVFPAQFAQAKFVIDSLDQWRFRPAVKDGLATAVEILLAIPNPDQ